MHYISTGAIAGIMFQPHIRNVTCCIYQKTYNYCISSRLSTIVNRCSRFNVMNQEIAPCIFSANNSPGIVSCKVVCACRQTVNNKRKATINFLIKQFSGLV
jgi:hypothetical protein